MSRLMTTSQHPDQKAAFGRPGAQRRHHVDGLRGPVDDPPAYLNADAAGRLHYPGFGPAAVSWLIEQRSVGALGLACHRVRADPLAAAPGENHGDATSWWS
jgi:hypothetical protein